MAATPTSGGAGIATITESLKTAVDALGKLATPGEDGGKDPESPITNEALEQLRWARKKYDSVVRWILGCFIAIALVIFGSLPFVQLTNVSLAPVAFGLIAAALGLGLIIWAASRAFEPEDASLGELEQTLEKIDDWLPYGQEPDRDQVWELRLHPRRKAALDLRNILMKEPRSHIGPGMDNVRDLIEEIGTVERRILELRSGASSTVHLEAFDTRVAEITSRQLPLATEETVAAWRDALRVDRKTTEELLLKAINSTFGTVMDDSTWKGVHSATLTDEEVLIPEVRLPERKRERAEFAERAKAVGIAFKNSPPHPPDEALDADLEDDLAEVLRLVERIENGGGGTPKPAQSMRYQTRGGVIYGYALRPISRVAAATEVEPEEDDPDKQRKADLAKIKKILPTQAALSRSAELLRAEARLKVRAEARDLLLSESGISQLRGTFRLVRALLLVGAVLVLSGGAIYAWAVANPPLTGLDTEVTVTLDSIDDKIPALPAGCTVSDLKQPLVSRAILLTAENPANPNDGAFSVLMLDACEGKRAEVGDDQGSVALPVPASTATDEPTSADEEAFAAGSLIVATLAADSEAWKTARGECEVDRGQDLVVKAILRSATDDDGARDGPFSITIVDPALCPDAAVAVDIADGEGSFILQ